jgi:type II secretory pathway pseudopilin PulG
MIETIIGIVALAFIVSGTVYVLAMRKYKRIKAQAEASERAAREEIARMREERMRKRREFNSQLAAASNTPKPVVTSITPSTSHPTTRTADSGSDMLTAMILNQAMNSPTGIASGTVSWDGDVPTITPVPEVEPERKSSYTSSYSSSSSDDDSSSRSSYSSSYSSDSSSSSDSSYSSSND